VFRGYAGATTDSQGMSPDAIADVVFAHAAPLELDVLTRRG
jgi:hypothetical protein